MSCSLGIRLRPSASTTRRLVFVKLAMRPKLSGVVQGIVSFGFALGILSLELHVPISLPLYGLHHESPRRTLSGQENQRHGPAKHGKHQQPHISLLLLQVVDTPNYKC